MTFSRSWSGSDGHGNLVNAIAPEPQKGFVSKLTQVFPILGPRTDEVLTVMCAKFKITETFLGRGIPIYLCH